MSEKSTFFQTTLTFVTDTFGTTMLDKVGNFMNGIAPIFEICFGIFLLLWVFHFWANGSFTEMGIDFIKKCIAWSFIIALAVNIDTYMKVAKLIYDLDADVVGLFSGKPYDGNVLDIVMDDFNKIQEDTNEVFKAYNPLQKAGHAFQYVSQWIALHFFGGIFLIICFAFGRGLLPSQRSILLLFSRGTTLRSLFWIFPHLCLFVLICIHT